MDLDMPELNGLAATRLISAESPAVKVVILTASEEDANLFDAIKSGAQGYMYKNLASDELFRLLEGVSHGEPALTPGLARKLLGEFARPVPAPPQRPVDESTPGLTDSTCATSWRSSMSRTVRRWLPTPPARACWAPTEPQADLGRRTVNVLPTPGVLSTESVPSWSSTRPRAMARPRPVPTTVPAEPPPADPRSSGSAHRQRDRCFRAVGAGQARGSAARWPARRRCRP